MARSRRSAPVRDITEAIRKIRDRVENHGEYFLREERSRYGLIDPMLRALGWDLSDPAQVKVEYDHYADRRNGKRMLPDYALFVEGQDGNQMPGCGRGSQGHSLLRHSCYFMKKPPRPEWDAKRLRRR